MFNGGNLAILLIFLSVGFLILCLWVRLAVGCKIGNVSAAAAGPTSSIIFPWHRQFTRSIQEVRSEIFVERKQRFTFQRLTSRRVPQARIRRVPSSSSSRMDEARNWQLVDWNLQACIVAWRLHYIESFKLQRYYGKSPSLMIADDVHAP